MLRFGLWLGLGVGWYIQQPETLEGRFLACATTLGVLAAADLVELCGWLFRSRRRKR